MDTLMALRHAREQGSMVLSICNTQVASIPCESDAVRSSTRSRACRPRSNGCSTRRHGPIALVDEGELVVFIMPPERGRDVLHAKVRSGIEEVKSRGAFIIAVAEHGDRDDERYADVVFRRPECPTLMSPLVDVVPLQLFAMDMAEIKGYDVDKPRNLAKSVTVE